MGESSVILLVINDSREARIMVATIRRRKHVTEVIVCNTVKDLRRLRPEPGYWPYLQFVLSEGRGGITPEQLAAWVKAVAPRPGVDITLACVQPINKRQAKRELPTSFVGRFYAALEQP